MTYVGNEDIPSGVRLASTLRQNSLCPGEEFATFSCIASGTELVWIVGGRSISFNQNAIVGASRISPEGNIRAILMNIDSEEGAGYAVRLSVLTVSAEPQAIDMLSVKCHNGSDHVHVTEEIQYIPKHAGLLLTMSIQSSL